MRTGAEKLLEAKAVEHNAALGSIYEIKAEERAKKDYTFVRNINKVDCEGGIQIYKDLDTDISTATIKVNHPSGTFAFLIK